MARKNAKILDKGAGGLDGVVYDSSTRSVMAQSDSRMGDIREKVAAVKEVVTGSSKHEISMVLQHYDNDVQTTIQAFLDNGATDILQEWHSTVAHSNKPANKKKKKNKNKDKSSPPADPAAVSSSATLPDPNQKLLTNSGTAPPGGTNKNLQAPLEKRSTDNTRDSKYRKPSNRPGPSVTPQGAAPPNASDPSPGYKHKVPSSSVSAATAESSPSATASTTTITTTSSHSASVRLSNNLAGDSSSRQTDSVKDKSRNKSRNDSSTTSSSLAGHQPQSSVTTSQTPEAHSSEVMGRATNKGPVKGKGRPAQLDVTRSSRERTVSEASVSSLSHDKSKKPHAGLEKPLKDLQRQTTSLHRQHHLLEEEINRSNKLISSTFEQLIDKVKDREVKLLFEMSKVKTEAQGVLSRRQDQGAALKVRMDRAPGMNDAEIHELRADVKHFVSERKIDEDLGSTKRFECELQTLLEAVENFGTVKPVKATYSTRRPSISSVTSSIFSHDDILSPLSPPAPSQPSSTATTPAVLTATPTATATPFTAPPPSKGPMPVGAKVISQSESVTQYEVSEMANPSTKDTKPSPRQRFSQNLRPRPGPQQGKGQQNQPRSSGQGQGQDQKGQRLNEKTEDQDKTEQGDPKKSRSARRRQKVRQRQREQRQHSQDGAANPRSSRDDKPQTKKQPQPRGGPSGDASSAQVKSDSQGSSGTANSAPKESRRNRRTPSPRKDLRNKENKERQSENVQNTSETKRTVSGSAPSSSPQRGQSATRRRRPRSRSMKSRDDKPQPTNSLNSPNQDEAQVKSSNQSVVLEEGKAATNQDAEQIDSANDSKEQQVLSNQEEVQTETTNEVSEQQNSADREEKQPEPSNEVAEEAAISEEAILTNGTGDDIDHTTLTTESPISETETSETVTEAPNSTPVNSAVGDKDINENETDSTSPKKIVANGCTTENGTPSQDDDDDITVTTVTKGHGEEEALPQRKVRTPRRRNNTPSKASDSAVDHEDLRPANGVHDDTTTTTEEGSTLTNGDVPVAQMNGHDTD